MIVEDEAPIQRSIKSAVESSHEQFRVIATAFNGQEALELLNHLKPDIIITDIRMRIMDGLALTEKVRALYPHIEIVFLSGYQEFDYARKAMLLGVKHYLLKPISKSQMKELLDAIYSDILRKKQESHQQYASALVHGRSISNSLYPEPELYGRHLLILCCAGPIPFIPIDDDIPGKAYWEQSDLQTVLSEVADGVGDVAIVDGKSVSEKVAMISFYRNRTTGRSPQEWLNAVASHQAGAIPLSIACSEPYTDPQMTNSALHRLRSRLYKNMVFGVPVRIWTSDPVNYGVSDPKYDPLTDRKLAVAAEQSNIEMIKSEIQKLFNEWKLKLPRQIYIEKTLRHILVQLHHSVASSSNYPIEMLEYDVSKMILHSTDYKELFFQTGTFIDFLFSTRLPGKSTDKLAVKIEEYLQEHFAKPINHQQLSEKFGIVPSYLSKIFAKHKGISPAKYIVQLRMAKAKELLLEHPDWLAKDIAEIVGYPDPNYFSRIFKRETGLYPSEFRDQP